MFKILYDDKNLVVFIKEPGYISEKISYGDVFGNDSGTLYCVHRLDKEVGGVTIAAKDEKTAAVLSKGFSNRDIKKTYLAVIQNRPVDDSGTYEDFLYHDIRTNKTFIAKSERKGVKKAVLDYTIIGSKSLDNGDISLVQIKLQTGRTHQIRVQFASRKMPLIGDQRYGSKIRMNNIALWSNSLSFIHPYTNEQLEFKEDPSRVFPWNKF